MPSMRLALAALALVFMAAAPAQAGLTVCNKTSHTTRLALGRFNGTQWMSEGWWTIEAEACTSVITAPLDARYYYLYASDGGPGSWDGNRGFCVGSSEAFKINGRADCARRGFERKGFFEVDTGRKTDYTQLLSD